MQLVRVVGEILTSRSWSSTENKKVNEEKEWSVANMKQPVDFTMPSSKECMDRRGPHQVPIESRT